MRPTGEHGAAICPVGPVTSATIGYVPAMREQITLDSIDRHILEVLQSDGRISNVDLADRVGLTPTPCLRRVRRLEEEGVIAGYRAVLDRRRLGLGFTAFALVETEQANRPHIERFEAELATIPDVVEAHRALGVPDYILKVVARDLAHYERIYMERLSALPGARTVRTSVSVAEAKPPAALDLAAVPSRVR